MNRRTKHTNITKATKEKVWERDQGRCIFCGSSQAMTNAHVIPRSHGGLGVEENIVTACIICHYEMDQTIRRQQYLDAAKKYLKEIYTDWDPEKLIYKKC